MINRRDGRWASLSACLAAIAAAGACSSLTAPASAQTAPTDSTIETVVVTAEKRSEALKDVPASISVLTGPFLERTNSDSLETFANLVPGLDVQSLAPGQARITIRGISPDEQTGYTGVSYYIDEIPITAAGQRSQPMVRLYDIDRAEVLRGPQGTLYGEGSIGGTVRIITNKPNLNDTEVSDRTKVEATEHGGLSYSTDAMLNAPIIKDVLAFRLVLQDRHDGGWIDTKLLTVANPGLPAPARYAVAGIAHDANSATDQAGRAMLRYAQPRSASRCDLYW